MNNHSASLLNPSVSALVANWLNLDLDDRHTASRAISALAELRRTPPDMLAPCADAFPISGPTQPSFAPVSGSITLDTLPTIDRDVFGSAAFRNLGRGSTIQIYVAGSRGALGLAQRLQTQIFKIGFTRLTIEERIAQLRSIAYAAFWRNDTEFVEDAKFNDWLAEPLRIDDQQSANSPVRLLANGLAITLPAGLGADAFDQQLMAALDSRALDRFTTTDAGRQSCREREIDPALLQRFTMQRQSYNAARELFRFNPRTEAYLLVQLIEALVAQTALALMDRRG